ncbi:MAG: NADH-quinone oxidoreductase subunit NuoE [Rhodospirillales bacterium]|nr:NADH-quinone oxidoreductase subunit NuoE [Rhodospirillales bacterium]
MKKPFEIHAEYQPKNFAFKEQKKVDEILARYPKGRQRSAVMPLLDLAQRQTGEEGAKAKAPYGGWIPRAAMDVIADIIGVPPIKVYEVATFYSMYNLAPVGVHHVQCCTTTPCWLRGSADIVKACESELGIHVGETTKDGQFTLSEVECLGACVNAPMVQINDDYYEDLGAESMKDILKALEKGEKPPKGSQTGRHNSLSAAGATTLLKQAKKAGVAS